VDERTPHAAVAVGSRITGFWDPGTRQYTILGNEYRNEIKKGIRMANDLMAPELLLLPVSESKPAGESS
jgi:hypothetical protein